MCVCVCVCVCVCSGPSPWSVPTRSANFTCNNYLDGDLISNSSYIQVTSRNLKLVSDCPGLFEPRRRLTLK